MIFGRSGTALTSSAFMTSARERGVRPQGVLNKDSRFSMVLLEDLITGISAVDVLETSSVEGKGSTSAVGVSSVISSLSVTLSVKSARASSSSPMDNIVPSVDISKPFLLIMSFMGSFASTVGLSSGKQIPMNKYGANY